LCFKSRGEKLNALQSNKYKTLSKNLLKKPSEKKKKRLTGNEKLAWVITEKGN